MTRCTARFIRGRPGQGTVRLHSVTTATIENLILLTEMFLLMRGMIKSDLTATLIRPVGKLGMPLGETLKLVLVTTLTLLVGEPRQIGHVAAMLAVTRGAG